MGADERRRVRCSFCGRRQDQVERLIAGPRGVFICDRCVELCVEVLDECHRAGARPSVQKVSWMGVARPSLRQRLVELLRRAVPASP